MTIDAGVGNISEPLSGRRWDPPEIRRQVALRIRSYRSHGFAPGDRVLILFGNRLEFFAELLAIWRLGGCAIPVNPNLTPFEIGKLAETSAACYCVVDDATGADKLPAVPNATVLHTLQHESGEADPGSPGSYPRLDDDALIVFTSGSTGQPKGVVHTHRSLYSRLVSLQLCLGSEDIKRALFVLPTHAMPLVSNCLFPWLSGHDLFITPPFNANVLMHLGELIDEQQISFVMTVPAMWNLVLKAANPPNNRSLRRVHTTSAPLARETWVDIQRWSGIQNVVSAYGATETASSVAGALDRSVVPESGLIGPPWGSRLKIVRMGDVDRPNDPDAECAQGDTGMLWLATPGLMRGYFRRQDLTDAVVKQGWFMTGDIALLDGQGRLFLMGRESDEINKGGVKIYPGDIDLVAQQFAATDDVCTFRIPDDLYGENIGIALVLSERSDASIRRLYRWLESRLARHKMPARWYLMDALPRISRSKINRDAIMRLCESQKPLDLSAIIRETR